MTRTSPGNPWAALSALCLGFFMILVDSTIVSVATPAIMVGLDADINRVVWVTSAYLLAYAVPLLITGRMGDRFGPKRMYLIGLSVFTLASLWCGLTTDIHSLIVARIVQGLGAAVMTPQTMAVITRIFPPNARGQALGAWGAVAGVATLVGPILGGVIVDTLGWAWIFFVNVPVGVIGLALAAWLVPSLETHGHRFDLLGVALSAIGMFCLVFGIQQGHGYDWGQIWGPISVPALIVAGLIVFGLFVWWQHANSGEPLVPLRLFRDRNFSLANIAITTVGFTVTAMTFPLMLWAQAVLGYSPTQAALLTAPTAVLSGVLAPGIGRLVDRGYARRIAVFGLGSLCGSLFWLSRVMDADTPAWQILLPMTLLGLANGCMWSPLSSTATRYLPMADAGAGAGVYNTLRQVGAVLGSAAIAVVMEARLAAQLGTGVSVGGLEAMPAGQVMPAAVADGYSAGMADAMLLPALVPLIGVIAVMFFRIAKPGDRAARS